MALAGSGIESDPWMITTAGEFNSVIRNASESGFYRVASDIEATAGGYWGISTITTAVGATYAPKVIDGNGFTIRFAGSQGTSNTSCLFAGIHFKNFKLHLSLSISGSYTAYLYYRCSLTDVATYVDVVTSYSPSTQLVYSDAATPFIIPRDVTRALLFREKNPASDVSYFINSFLIGVTAKQCYVKVASAVNINGGFIKRPEALTLSSLDALTNSAFSDNGWWTSGLEMVPWQSELVALTLQTVASGSAVSRRLWLENERQFRYLGETDATGLAQYGARIRKWSSFTVYASEDLAADALRNEKAISEGTLYLPPSENGFVYKAASSGRITSLTGVVFNDQPVTIDSIVFSPRPCYTAVVSKRRSVLVHGVTQTILLDNSAGGGGPVVTGDPAYLDGVVEEIHPMTGARQALANCEVVAFERRGSAYVAMGNTFSDGVGGFRLETDIYGGGDVFAFAADFPGGIFQPGASLNVGDRIRPALANGYVYEIVQPGNAGTSEPVWWPDQGGGTEGVIGSARARARPYYQPVGHGPLKMTLIE